MAETDISEKAQVYLIPLMMFPLGVPVSHISEPAYTIPATGAGTPEWNVAVINIISYICVCQVNMYIA